MLLYTTSETSSSRSQANCFLRDITVSAGETVPVNLESPLRTVMAQIRWADTVPAAGRGQVRVSLDLDQPTPPKGVLPEKWREWFQRELGGRPSRHSRSYAGRLETNGMVEFKKVDFGLYRLQAWVPGTSAKDYRGFF